MKWAKAQGDHMAEQEWGGRQEGDPTREQKPQSLIRAGVAGGADGTLLAFTCSEFHHQPLSLDGGAPPPLLPSMVLPRRSLRVPVLRVHMVAHQRLSGLPS